MVGRILYKDRYDAKGYTDENSLNNALLTQPDMISTVLTHIGGRENEKFPMTFMTEGQAGGADYQEINDAQYQFRTMHRGKKHDVVVSSTYSGTDKPGIGKTDFYVVFKTRWLVEQHPVVSAYGTKARIMAPPKQLANGYQYKFRLLSPSASAYCPLTDLVAGTKWSMIGNGIVSESDSMGNRSNIQTPGMMVNQLSFMRKSYRYSGNIANKYVEIELMTGKNKKTMYWLEYEMFQHHMEWLEMSEEWMWESIYNRNADGVIDLIDEESGKPIPIGAGLIEQIPNNDTYGVLTYNKLYQLIGDTAYGATDTDQMEFVLYAGKGFLRDFDEAVKNRASSLKAIEGGAGTKFIEGSGRNLILTGFFKQFEHVDGHRVIVKWLPLLDFGGRAEAAPKHPISNLPMTSHEAFFIDQSIYDGQRNVKMVAQKGRSMNIGVKLGMAPSPGEQFGAKVLGNAAKYIATEQDTNSVHYFGSKSINIFRNQHCLHVKCNLS